jgi:membrane dipeptidase
MKPLPIIDLHCDLLSYLAHIPGASLHKQDDIGAALPHLREGNVRLQVLAIFTLTREGSASHAAKQAAVYADLVNNGPFVPGRTAAEVDSAIQNQQISVVAAIENASGLCEEDEPITLAFERLESLRAKTGRLLYISFTHHTENRFGGGNYSDNVGLKADGMSLLDYLNGKDICVDLAHSSDAMAEEIFSYVSRHRLDIPIIASHSNFRRHCDHVRNLPDELAQEIILQGGIIGVNFLRDYLDENEPEKLFDHLRYGLELGPKSVGFGADFFYFKNFPDQSRFPLFFQEFANASAYPRILKELKPSLSKAQRIDLAYGNAFRFLRRIWQE